MRSLCFVACGALALTAAVCSAAPPPATPERHTLPWAQAQAQVEAYFAQRGVQPTDLICRSEVESVLASLKKGGWTVAGAKDVLARVPADNSFLVQLLRQPNALKFMRKVGGYPDGYDRVDRMSKMPRGEIILRDLVQNPGGYELIQYMTESKWGKNFGKQLSNAPSGKNFNQPTGRIYTWPALLEELSARYDEATKPPKPAQSFYD